MLDFDFSQSFELKSEMKSIAKVKPILTDDRT